MFLAELFLFHLDYAGMARFLQLLTIYDGSRPDNLWTFLGRGREPCSFFVINHEKLGNIFFQMIGILEGQDTLSPHTLERVALLSAFSQIEGRLTGDLGADGPTIIVGRYDDGRFGMRYEGEGTRRRAQFTGGDRHRMVSYSADRVTHDIIIDVTLVGENALKAHIRHTVNEGLDNIVSVVGNPTNLALGTIAGEFSATAGFVFSAAGHTGTYTQVTNQATQISTVVDAALVANHFDMAFVQVQTPDGSVIYLLPTQSTEAAVNNVNEQRIQAGLPPVCLDDVLSGNVSADELWGDG